MQWLKLHTYYLDDPCLGSLPEDIQARFFKLYMLAKQCQEDGAITYTPDEVAWKLHISIDELNRTYEILNGTKYFSNNGKGPEITVFPMEQPTKDQEDEQRENNKERQTKYREKHKGVSNELVTQTDRESDNRESDREENQTNTNQEVFANANIPADDWKQICNTPGISETQARIAGQAYQLLVVTSLGNPKLLEASIILATRTSKESAIRSLMAVLASVYSNKKITNPPVIAYKMIKELRFPPEFMDPSRWDMIPPEVMEACPPDVRKCKGPEELVNEWLNKR